MSAAESLATTPAAPDPSLPMAAALEQIRNAERCPRCHKTRAVINVALARGWHQPVRGEHVSPQTHCACAEGPVAHADRYHVVFRRYGNQGRITVRTPDGYDEPLLGNTPLHPNHGLDFGKRSRGAENAAFIILQLVISPDGAAQLWPGLLRERIVPLGHRGGQFSLGDLRAWVATHAPEFVAAAPTWEPATFHDYIEGFIAGKTEAGDVAQYTTCDALGDALVADLRRRMGAIGQVMTAHYEGRVLFAATVVWRRLHPVDATSADAVREGTAHV